MGRLGLDPGAEYVLNHLEKKFGSLILYPDVAGYRAEKNIPSASRTEHFTRDAIDLQFKDGDWARAEKVLNYCLLNCTSLGLEGLLWNNTQWGYEAYGYSRWNLPQRQWWQPPAGWRKDGDFGISDPFHERHIHLKVIGTFKPPKDEVPTGDTTTGAIITVKQLAAISQNPDPVYYDLAGDVKALVPEMKKAGITTKLRIAAFLGNGCQETDHLKTLEEYGDEAYFRSFLGDQWMYHGRGYLMNTWRAAYQRLSKVLGVDLVGNPDMLAQRKDLAARAATWYWTENSINTYADAENYEAVCSLINRGEVVPSGPINGWDMRCHFYFQRALEILSD